MINQQLQPLPLQSIFIATVTETDESKITNWDGKRLGRVQISIPNLLDDSDKTLLPWAYTLQPTLFGQNQTTGVKVVPTKNSKVVVTFINGDIYNPFIIGTLIDPSNPIAQWNNNSYGLKDPIGNEFKVDNNEEEQTSTISLTHKSGTSVIIGNDGSININVIENIDTTAKNITINGEQITTNGKLTVNGTKVTSDGTPGAPQVTGAFCAIATCPFVQLPHLSKELILTEGNVKVE